MRHRRSLVRVAALVVLTGAAPAVGQRSLLVPSQYKTIQAAIDAAGEKDSILVDAGVYPETLDFKGKKIRVQSTQGAERTVIDGGGNGSVVTFTTGETRDTLLAGFTVRNGTGTTGGWSRLGGGILCRSASPYLSGLVIENNAVTGLFGYGGGIYVEGGEPLLVGCTLRNNTASHGGGGLYVADSRAVIAMCKLIENHADLGGGALFSRGEPIVSSSAFVGNTARGGAGIYAQLDVAHPKTFTNNTIAANRAQEFGGGFASASEVSRVENCILWDNVAPLGAELSVGRDCSICVPSRVTIAYSVVKGGQGGVWIGTGATLTWGTGMLDADPQLFDVTRGDVHLQYGSPCRDRGNAAAASLPAEDLDSGPRVVGPTVDIGADEFAPRLYQVGRAVRGGSLDLRIVGFPGGFAVWAFSQGLIHPPLHLPPLGDLYLDPGRMTVFFLAPLPANGVLPFSLPVPQTFPVIAIPMQALAGNALMNHIIVQFLDR